MAVGGAGVDGGGCTLRDTCFSALDSLRAPPLTAILVNAMAAHEISFGRLDMACMLLLGFLCLLRTGEFLSLSTTDFSLGTTTGICSLRNTKPGRREGVNEVVSITDMATLETLRQLILFRKQMNGSQCLWQHSQSVSNSRNCVILSGFKAMNFNHIA